MPPSRKNRRRAQVEQFQSSWLWTTGPHGFPSASGSAMLGQLRMALDLLGIDEILEEFTYESFPPKKL